MTAPDPNLYFGIPEADYRAWEAECQSSLKVVTALSVRHYQAAETVPSEPSEAKDLGSAFHVCLQERKRWDDEYVCGIDVDRRTTKGKAAWAAFLAEHAGKAVLKRKDYEMLEAMRDSVWSDTTCRALLTAPGATEVSIVARDPETGLLLKGRIDRLTEWQGYTAVLDWKSIDSGERSNCARAVANYGYHFQAAFYLHLLECLEPGARRFLLGFVEKRHPHVPVVYELDEGDLDQGRAEFQSALRRVAKARESGIYPGYNEGTVEVLRLPGWARRDPEFIE